MGPFSEQYDPVAKRQLGNFPQAFTHVAFIRSAASLADVPLSFTVYQLD